MTIFGWSDVGSLRPLFLRYKTSVFEPHPVKRQPYQRIRRERPMCRSAAERTEPLPIKTRHVPHHVIPTVALAEWRNPPRKIKNQRKIKQATREDSSTPFYSARNDMSVGGSVCPHKLYLSRNGTAHRPFPTYFNEWVEINNAGRSNNCQLSIVNCQFLRLPSG